MRILAFLFCIFITSIFNAQSGEFKKHSNGLIYSENTMSKLAHIVDSLNLKYKSCDFNKTFYSKSQAIAYKIELDDKKSQVKKDMENGISIQEFKLKYPKVKVDENVLVVRFQYKNYEGEDVLEFSEISLTDDYGLEIHKKGNLKPYLGDLKSKWVYREGYSKNTVKAFYFHNGFKSIPLNEKYKRMIGYADCLIDTTTTKLKEELEMGMPMLPDNWDKLSNNEQEKLLDKMRGTRVVGSCSMDSSPRIHAANIAVLAAETINWEVFLKAHLDIMNDRFERVSDGSYAWKGRKTYIKELEELDIKVLDLILGISLRIENPAQNHYYGSIGRVGRALSETKNAKEIEEAILRMIKDESLDDYNRVIAYYLYSNYAHNLANETIKKEKVASLKQVYEYLPEYLIK